MDEPTTWRPPAHWSQRVRVEGANLHCLELGAGPDVVLLHGWPEYCGVWRRLMVRLRDAAHLIAPDLRDFGFSRSDGGPGAVLPTPDVLARDVLGLLDRRGIARAVIVSHDIGAFVAQQLARSQPERVRALVFFDCPHPAIGARYGSTEHAIETWYQHFHRLPLARELVGQSAATCRIYLRHFLSHLAADPDAFTSVLEEWVEVFMQPGVLEGGFAWYSAVWPLRQALIEGRLPPPASIRQRTRILWGLDDPVTPFRWSDRLAENFAEFSLTGIAGAGHFPHWQQPDRVAGEIRAFLASLPAD